MITFNLFPGGKMNCITMSFDDGRIYDRNVVSILNKYQMKGTFFLNSSFLDSDDYLKSSEIKELYKGHEVGVHTLTHPHLNNLSSLSIYNEVLEDKKALEALMNYPIRGMSYPFGKYNDTVIEVLRNCGIEYSRTCEYNLKYTRPYDYLKWHSTCHLRGNEDDVIEPFFTNRFNKLQLLYVWTHSYEFNDHNNYEVLEDFCKKARSHDDIWYATNIEVIEYLKALDQLVISANEDMLYNPTITPVWVSVNNEKVKVLPGEIKYL